MGHSNHWEFYFSQNALIIQIVVSVILLLTIYVIYRSYFSKSASESRGFASQASVDSLTIEKTLEKILEKQLELQQKVQSVPRAGGTEVADPEVEAKLLQAESKLTELKNEVDEKQKQIQELQSAGGTVGGSNGASEDLKQKLQELETKLAEYEIISDDLADLSKYKSENLSLKKELDELRKGKGAASVGVVSAPSSVAPAAPVAPSSAPAATIAPAEQVPTSTPTPAAPAPTSSASEDSTATPAAENAVSVAAETGDIKEMIDDELMKEFEMAVAQQKKGVDEPAAKEAEKSEIKAAEAGELIDQFENFVKKE